MKLVVLALALGTAGASVCVDDPSFIDENGNPCSFYALTTCSDAVGISDAGVLRLLESCQATCNSCVKAADVCEINGAEGANFIQPFPLVSFLF